METRFGYASIIPGKKISFWPAYVCFFIFGLLNSFNKPEIQAGSVFLSIVSALVVGVLNVKLLILVFKRLNPLLRREMTDSFPAEAVSAAMLFMIPFTVLASLAQLLLDWNGVMPFASAAMMTVTATAGTEVMKKGAQGIKNVIVPSGVAFVLSTLWMLMAGLLP